MLFSIYTLYSLNSLDHYISQINNVVLKFYNVKIQYTNSWNTKTQIHVYVKTFLSTRHYCKVLTLSRSFYATFSFAVTQYTCLCADTLACRYVTMKLALILTFHLHAYNITYDTLHRKHWMLLLLLPDKTWRDFSISQLYRIYYLNGHLMDSSRLVRELELQTT